MTIVPNVATMDRLAALIFARIRAHSIRCRFEFECAMPPTLPDAIGPPLLKEVLSLLLKPVELALVRVSTRTFDARQPTSEGCLFLSEAQNELIQFPSV